MKYFATVLLLLVSIGTASSQITITYDQYLQALTSMPPTSESFTSTDMSGLSTLIAASGPNQSWDFGNRVYTKNQASGTTTVFAYPGNAPMANDPDFTMCTHVQKIVSTDVTQGTIYYFLKLDQSGAYNAGIVQDSMGTYKKIYGYAPPLQTMKFPCTYQTSWSGTSDMHISFDLPGLVATESDVTIVDGFGSLVLPTSIGSKNPSPKSTTSTLRVKKKQTQTISFSGFGTTTTTMGYEWMSMGNGAAIAADSNSNPLSVSYNIASTGAVSFDQSEPTAFHLGANPASSSTFLFVTLPEAGQTRIALIDAVGRESKSLINGFTQAGDITLPLDVTSLANGTYLLRVESSGLTAVRKLIVAH